MIASHPNKEIWSLMKHLLMLLLALAVLILAACGSDAADCNEEKKQSCSQAHSTCVATCNPLAGMEECTKKCNTDLCACLDEGGCDCEE